MLMTLFRSYVIIKAIFSFRLINALFFSGEEKSIYQSKTGFVMKRKSK